jgi:uncharacterized membrane protein
MTKTLQLWVFTMLPELKKMWLRKYCYTKCMSIKFHENISRSVIKAITFRVLVIVSNSVIVFIFTRKPDLTFNVMALTSIASTVLYVFHERIWNHVHWGKQKKIKNKNEK